MRTVLLLNVYKFTGNDLGDLKKRNLTEDFFLRMLPEYCIRTDNHKINYTENYFQFTENGEENYWLFNIVGSDDILTEEISNVGIAEVLQDYDLSEIFENISYNTYENFGRNIPTTSHIIVDIEYTGGYNAWTGDNDFDINISLSYLTENGICFL